METKKIKDQIIDLPVEVDLSEFLGLDFMANSYTKEEISKAFKALTKPCISLERC